MSNARYRTRLPQLNGTAMLTDGGLETTLIFHEGLDLPCFAAFDQLSTDRGREAIERYFRRYAGIAVAEKKGLVLDSPTWRASESWGSQLGYDAAALDRANREAIALLDAIRRDYENEDSPMVVAGNIGPRGDGYRVDEAMSVAEAERYHGVQMASFADTAADMVTVLTMTYVEEAIGVTRAGLAAELPVALAFTVETDGRLPSGQPLGEAIEQVDRETGAGPAYYMLNCAHPDHFRDAIVQGGDWRTRIRGLRANASRLSHAELDEAEELDDGNPVELAGQYRELGRFLPNLSVLGGCCGTDHRHISAISCHAYG